MSRIGWRWWDLGKDGSLRSVNDELWPPNEPLHATCIWEEGRFGTAGTPAQGPMRAEHRTVARNPKTGMMQVEYDPVPAEKCTCGFWAYYDPEIASGLPHVGSYLRTTKVFGAIEAWGGIVEHELGFRCEWAIPRGVWVIRGRLHNAYEVQRFPNLRALTDVWDYEATEED